MRLMNQGIEMIKEDKSDTYIDFYFNLDNDTL